MSFKLREANSKDLDSLHGLWMEIMHYHKDQGPMFAYDSAYDSDLKKSLSERLSGEKQRCFVAVETDDVVGCIFCSIKTIPPFIKIKKTGYIAETVVSAKARGKGIGTALVQRAQEWFDENNCEATELQVAVQNESGIKFWKRLGFKPSTFHMHRVN